MANLQYMPGDPRLVDQLVYELKSKGIFDQFRKDCIADVDTRPAYQNLRQRVETSVSTFLSRQCWKPDLNKNQLREKLRKHILDGNYLEQGVERIVDQVVNPKVASVFIPQVEDLVYNYLGIPRKKAPGPETEKKPEDLLPTDLEAVSPGSVKSNDGKNEEMDIDQTEKIDVEHEHEAKEVNTVTESDIQMSEVTVESNEMENVDKSSIPLPAEEIKLENIPAPVNSPPKATKVELDSIALPKEPIVSTNIPLPDEAPKSEKDTYFKSLQLHSDDSGSSSDSSLRRNMSPLTPIRNFNNENSCDAQQGFDNDSDSKSNEKAAPSSFRFTIESKDGKDHNSNSNPEIRKDTENKNTEQIELSYQFTNQVNLNNYNTPMYDDSSNSNNLRIDYESDVNSKTNIEMKPEIENSLDSKKDKKSDDRKSHKSSHRSRDSSRHSSSKDKRPDSKHSTSRDSSRHDKKSSKDEKSKSSKERDRSKDTNERKDRDSSKHHESSRNSHKNSKDKDSKSHRSSSSSHRHSSKSSDERKSSSSKDKEKNSESSRDRSKDKPRDSKSSSSKSDKDRKSSSSKKSDDKDKKKEKKDIDDHYSSSGRGNHSRRSTDRDSNDGSSSSKGSQNHNGTKSSENKKDNKSSSSKSDNTSTSGESPSPSDKEHMVKDNSKISQCKPIRVDNHLETPIATPPRLPFVPDITLKKPKFAANFQEAKKLMKMRKFLDEEQKRMNQEAALLLEFQANVRPSLSQVYSSIPGPELEFACVASIPVDSISYEVANLISDEVQDTNKDIKAEQIENVHSEIIETPNEKDENIKPIERHEEVENVEPIEEQIITPDQDLSQEPMDKNCTYDENKPFSELMDEITEYSKASETKSKTDIEETLARMEEFEENIKPIAIQNSGTTEVIETSNSIENKYFEVTIITEELSESEETEFEPKDEVIEEAIELENPNSIENALVIDNNMVPESNNTDNNEMDTISIAISTASTENENVASTSNENVSATEEFTPKIQNELQYFAEHEKYNAELQRHEFSSFLKDFIEAVNAKKKIYLLNCDAYEENIMKEVASTMGDFEFVNYYKNGHLKPNTTTNVVKDVSLSSEVILPVESKQYEEKSPLFSPVKSECSFELHSDYDSKLEDINKKSRQEVMEIILGSIIDSSPSKMPEVDYYTESMIENEMEDGNTKVKTETENTIINEEVKTETENLKRSIDKVESSVNNNRSVLMPKKMRKLSDSDQISSTTEESEEVSNNNKVCASTRSKYLGRARRVGLPRPKRNNLSNSPSSDKSVENYVQNTPPPLNPNGKIKTTPRSKVQRYDTSDLYKPKLHYLSRRHNVS